MQNFIEDLIQAFKQLLRLLFKLALTIACIVICVVIYFNSGEIGNFFAELVSEIYYSFGPSAYEDMEKYIKTHYDDDYLYLVDFDEGNIAYNSASVLSKKSKDTHFKLYQSWLRFSDDYEKQVLSKKNTIIRHLEELQDKKFPGWDEFDQYVRYGGKEPLVENISGPYMTIFITSEEASRDFIEFNNSHVKEGYEITTKRYYFPDTEPEDFYNTYKNIEIDSDLNTDVFLFKLVVYAHLEKDKFSYTYMERYIKNTIALIKKQNYDFDCFEFSFSDSYNHERRYIEESSGGYPSSYTRSYSSGDILILEELTEEQVLSENFYKYIKNNTIKKSWTNGVDAYINPDLKVLD